MEGAASYQATYRRSEVAIPLLICSVALFFVGLWLVLRDLPNPHLMAAVLGLVGALLLAMVLILLMVFSVHRWTIEPEGLRIVERPKVPLMGRTLDLFVPWSDILAVRRVESGFDRQIEIVSARGRRHRLSQDHVGKADLGAFAEALRAASVRAGRALPETSEGLSFWNTAAGIFFVAVLFVAACAIAGVTGWALWDGMTTRQPRSGYFAAIALLLPVGAGWLLLNVLRRRRVVLAGLRGR
jgi:hypothetical protein